MQVRLHKETEDSKEAIRLFQEFKKLGNAYMTYDYKTFIYDVEVIVKCETESEQHRIILKQIFLNTAAPEEQDALAYADSAIKTLVDMGVLK